jgi:hypothetical protein
MMVKLECWRSAMTRTTVLSFGVVTSKAGMGVSGVDESSDRRVRAKAKLEWRTSPLGTGVGIRPLAHVGRRSLAATGTSTSTMCWVRPPVVTGQMPGGFGYRVPRLKPFWVTDRWAWPS